VYEDISPRCIGIAECPSKPIRRAVNAATATIQNVRVHHCRTHVFVAQEFLNRSNIVTVLKQVSGERMTKTVAHCRFGYPRLSHSVFYRLLQHGLVQMVPAPFSRNLICKMTGCRKYPLPTQLFPRVGIFALKRIRQSNSAQASLKIASVEAFDPIEVLRERFFYRRGKHRVPVFVSLTRPDHDLVVGEINILYSQTQALHQPQASPIKERSFLLDARKFLRIAGENFFLGHYG
jgi:hypothetical protein